MPERTSSTNRASGASAGHDEAGQDRFRDVIRNTPHAYLIVHTDDPHWTIVDASDAYLAVTHKTREEIIGRRTFDAFPESEETMRDGGERNVRGSFEHVLLTGNEILLPIQRYDLPRPAHLGGGFEEHYWQLGSRPVRDAKGETVFVLHHVENVTARIQAARERDAAEARAADVLDSMSDAYIMLDKEFRLTYMNAAAARMNSMKPIDVVGKSHWDIWPASVGTNIEETYRHVMRERGAVHFETRYFEQGKLDVWLEVDTYAADDGGLGIFFRDISERKRAEEALQDQAIELEQQTVELESQVDEGRVLTERLERANAEIEARARASSLLLERSRRLLALSAGLNRAVGTEEVADVILGLGITAVGADAGSFALVLQNDDAGPEFEVIRTSGFAERLVKEFHRFSVTAGRPLSDAILQRVPVLVDSRADAAARYPTVADVGYEAFVAVPVLQNESAVAAIAFSFSEPQKFDEQMANFLRTIGEQCAQALERARLYDAQERISMSTSFLAEASRVLSSSLEYEKTLRAVAEAAVPMLGDWCAVDVIDDPESKQWPPKLTRIAVVHQDPEKKALGLSLEERFPTDWSSPTGIPGVLRDGTIQFVPEINDDMLAAAARSEEHLQVLRALQFTSVIIVPLKARDLTLGVLTLVMSNSGRQYTASDVSLATDLAARAGVAIDNARLFREAQLAWKITDEARASAVSASKAKSDFLATMSHEIRTPINAVLGYSELLELELAGPLTENQRTQLGRIRSSTAHLLGLVNEVLDLAKIESGTLHIQPMPANAGDTVDAALALIRPQAAAKGISLSEHCEGARTVGYFGDEYRVCQVLTNLLSNAVKFTDPGGSISVSCSISGNGPHQEGTHIPFITFSVVDTGIGIASEQLQRIFEPFTQAEKEGQTPYTRERSGTGLGLAISRQLAQLMDGEITVTSEPTIGSTFTLWLPAHERREHSRSDGDEQDVGVTAAGTETPDTRELRSASIELTDEQCRERIQAFTRVGTLLTEAVATIVRTWSERMRADPNIPESTNASDAQIEDHFSSLLTDFAVTLRILGGAGSEPSELMRSGTAISRVISEQHGQQRYRLGWSEASINREMQLLEDTVHENILDIARDLPSVLAHEASAAIAVMIQQSRRISLGSYRAVVGVTGS